MVACGTGAVAGCTSKEHTSEPVATKSEDLVRKLDLRMSQAEMKELFGPFISPSSNQERTLIEFPVGHGAVRRIEIGYDRVGGAVSNMTVIFSGLGPDDYAKAWRNLQQALPNRDLDFGTQSSSYGAKGTVGIRMGDTMLRFNPTQLSIQHQDSIHPTSVERARCEEWLSAAWALLRWAAFDAPAPSAEQLRWVAGPTLEDTAGLDPELAGQQLREAFSRKLPTGRCELRGGWNTCGVSTDDANVAKMTWLWPDGEKSRVQRVTLEFRSRPETERREAQRAVAICLKPVLGDGKEEIELVQKKERSWTWLIGDLGDQVVLDEREFRMTEGLGQPPERPPAWASRYPAITAAMAGCKR